MIPVAKRAISRLKELSSQARLLAAEFQKITLIQRWGPLKRIYLKISLGMIEKKIEYSNALCLLTEGQLNQNKKKMLDKLFRPTMSFLKLTLLILII